MIPTYFIKDDDAALWHKKSNLTYKFFAQTTWIYTTTALKKILIKQTMAIYD